MKNMIAVLAVLIGAIQANAAALRTNIGGTLNENTNIEIVSTSTGDGRLELFARDSRDHSKAWRCNISSEVANKSGYQLGQLQMILMSKEDVKIFCEQAKGNYEASRIVVIWDAKNSF